MPAPWPDAKTKALRLGQPVLRARDFFNAWDAAELERLVSGCPNALRHCRRGD